MAELKTKPTAHSVTKFLDSVADEQKRNDSYAIMEMMRKITKEEPKMWGPAIIGFGKYHYKYASGREGDWFVTGFSPRQQNISLYIMPGYQFPKYKALLKKLGKHKTGKACLYLNKLADIDEDVLTELIAKSVQEMSSKS